MSNNKERMLKRAAADITSGMIVNLGIGLPSGVADYVPKDCDVLLHSENGVLGVGAQVDHGAADRNLINAGGVYVSTVPGAAYFDSAISFSLVRAGRLDLTLLGAFEVGSNGDLANWIIPGKFAAGVGGAIELAQKARKVGIVTTHTDKHGRPKIVSECTLPLTARHCVDRIYTEMAVIDVIDKELHLIELAENVILEDVISATGAPMRVPTKELKRF